MPVTQFISYSIHSNASQINLKEITYNLLNRHVLATKHALKATPLGSAGLMIDLKICLRLPAQFFQPLLEKQLPPNDQSCSDPLEVSS